MELFTLSFRSIPIAGFDGDMLNTVVQDSYRHNERRDITSLLFYDGRYLMQTLEGPRDEVVSCFRRIKQDQRHFQVLPFAIEPIPERRVPVHCFKVIVDDTARAPVKNMGCFPYERPEVLSALRDLGLRQLKMDHAVAH